MNINFLKILNVIEKEINNKKGISLIEAILAIVILVFPIFATIFIVSFNIFKVSVI